MRILISGMAVSYLLYAHGRDRENLNRVSIDFQLPKEPSEKTVQSTAGAGVETFEDAWDEFLRRDSRRERRR